MTQERIEQAVDNFLQDSVFSKLLNRNAAIALAKYIYKFSLQNQWISVDEALPEKNTMCFVIKETELGIIYDTDYIDFEGKWFFNFNRTSIKSMVITHWCPIPQLKGGEE